MEGGRKMTEEKKATLKKVLSAIERVQNGETLQKVLDELDLKPSEFFLTLDSNDDAGEEFKKAKGLASRYLLEQAFAVFQDGINARKDGGVTGDVLRAAIAFLGSDGTFSNSQKFQIDGNISVTAGLAELAKALEERKGNRTDGN
jgi:hypothetical protein